MKMEICKGPTQLEGFVFVDERDEACIALNSSSCRCSGQCELSVVVVDVVCFFVDRSIILFALFGNHQPPIGRKPTGKLRTNSFKKHIRPVSLSDPVLLYNN